MVSDLISGTSPESTNTVSKLCRRRRASIMACPVPRCSLCSDEVDAGGGQRLAHSLGFVSDDGEDVLRRNDFAGCRYNVRQQRFSGDLVQDLGAARLQPRTFSGGQDRDGERAFLLVPDLADLEVGFAISIQRIASVFTISKLSSRID